MKHKERRVAEREKKKTDEAAKKKKEIGETKMKEEGLAFGEDESEAEVQTSLFGMGPKRKQRKKMEREARKEEDAARKAEAL
jgi:hypothetical protein